MAQLDDYLQRKSAAMAARTAEWTATPEAAHVRITASSALAGNSGARPTHMGAVGYIVSDSAPGLAGNALGPTAPEMLLGALASCLVHTYVIQAVLLQVPLDNVRVEISGSLDMADVIGLHPEARPMIENIEYVAYIESTASDKAIGWLHAAVEQCCPILNTLRQPGTVTRKEASSSLNNVPSVSAF